LLPLTFGLKPWSALLAQGAATNRMLVNTMLLGGADFRYAVAPSPDYDPAYVSSFWNARRTLYSSSYSSYADLYAALYIDTADPRSGLRFGIHRSCGWLADRFEAGNAAIVANVFGSNNRRHDHSQLIVETGDPGISASETNRDGWGGRLAAGISQDAHALVVSQAVSMIGMGTDPNDRLSQLIHVPNMRSTALPREDIGLDATHPRNVLSRALSAYYGGRAEEAVAEHAADWPYARFFGHFAALRAFGEAVAARLALFPMPTALAALSLNNPSFAQQCRNLYDAWICRDILNPNLVSMSYGGWDTHRAQAIAISANLADTLGSEGGLDVLTRELDLLSPTALDDIVFHFATDFGRQLAANGSAGTDHGRGNYAIFIGNSVNGGLYGETFPLREARADPADSLQRSPLQLPGADIEGLTSLQRVLGQCCDWIAPGVGTLVFPDAPTSALEAGVDLSVLFAA
jgi:uncharacterized protein (DUF1501 family)